MNVKRPLPEAEIKEAAGRWRNYEYQDDQLGQVGLDSFALAHAYVAEHPADEDEPVTGKWLESIGFAKDNGYNGYYILSNEAGWMEFIDLTGSVEVTVFGNEIANPPETRGQVRLLCRAIGIELKEPS